ncbi:ParB/RepB/Spo0J family partition protein [Paraburkholderia sediminicola]|uniref:IbrB-like domain-containing protein n=1 Tax=Paraburkholderia sediminicola TaxID=458836 RepID=UPI0038BA4C79
MTAAAIESGAAIPDAARPAIESAPVSRVTWIHRDRIQANDYNPNRVAPPELELLIVSILEDGFTQPLVVLDEGNGFVLVDGYHRWLVSADRRIAARYGGYVPVAQIDADPVHRMMSTIRHNRARGIHAVLPMADIVRAIIGAYRLNQSGAGLAWSRKKLAGWPTAQVCRDASVSAKRNSSLAAPRCRASGVRRCRCRPQKKSRTDQVRDKTLFD